MLKEVILLGTGTSGAVPNIHCLVEPEPSCLVCLDAIKYTPGSGLLPSYSKNRRRNTSALVRYLHSDGSLKNVLIDCGKSFYESALTWFCEYKLRKIDAVILTHGHADAMMGMDDLRQWTIGDGVNHKPIQDVVDIYLGPETMEVVSRAFPYMVDRGSATGGGEVPKLQFHLISEGPSGPLPFMIDELQVIPFKVEHGMVKGGNPYYAYGFRFEDVTYVSDANRFTSQARDIVRDSNILIIDALKEGPHPSHFSFQEALEHSNDLVRSGGRAYFTGMTHSVDHEDVNRYIAKYHPSSRIHIECGYDGQRIPIHSDPKL